MILNNNIFAKKKLIMLMKIKNNKICLKIEYFWLFIPVDYVQKKT